MSDGSLLKCSDSMKRSSRFQLMEGVSWVGKVQYTFSSSDGHGYRGVKERTNAGLFDAASWRSAVCYEARVICRKSRKRLTGIMPPSRSRAARNWVS